MYEAEESTLELNKWFNPLRFGRVTSVHSVANGIEIIVDSDKFPAYLTIHYPPQNAIENGILHEPIYKTKVFGKIESIESDSVEFVNCIFTEDISITNIKNVSFKCCFFLGSLELSNVYDSNSIKLDTCVIKTYFFGELIKTNYFEVVRSNILSSLFLQSVETRESFTIRSNHMRNIAISAGHFNGGTVCITDICNESGVDIRNCLSEDMILNSINTESLEISNSRFERIVLNQIYTPEPKTYEQLMSG